MTATYPSGTGPAGSDGRTILSGSGAPSSGLGSNGDFYIDNTAHALYGPKTSGSWGSGTSLVGPGGVPGGSAGGDLGGTYPSPTVQKLSQAWTPINARHGLLDNGALDFIAVANFNSATNRLVDTSLPGWRIRIGSGDKITLERASPTAGAPTWSVMNSLITTGIRAGAGAVLESNSAEVANFYANYDVYANALVDSSKPAWRVAIGSADQMVIYRAPATAGAPVWATIGTISAAGLANFVGGVQSNGANVASLNTAGVLTSSQAPLLNLAPAKTKLAKLENFAGPTGSGATTTLFTATGSGIVRTLWLVAAAARAISLDGRLQVFVDGESSPSIDVDLGTLFLWHWIYAFTPPSAQYSTLNFHGEQRDDNTRAGFLRFPIPYSNGITIKLLNPTGVATGSNAWYFQCWYEAGITAPLRLKSVGVPYAQASSIPAANAYNFCDITPGSPGWLVWHAMAMNSPTGPTYMERNLQITVDSEATPSILSSGTEDFFLGSFYYQGRTNFWTPVTAISAANHPTSFVNTQAVDLLALLGGVKFDTRLKFDLLTEALCVDAHTMGWFSLYYLSV